MLISILGFLAVVSVAAMSFLMITTSFKRSRITKRRNHARAHRKKKEKSKKGMFIVIFFFTLTIFSILPATIAYGVATDMKIEELELNGIITLVSIFGVMIFLCCLFFVGLLKELAKIISANIARYLGETFFIIEENEELTKKWFIYHPREKDSFLIGDAPLPEDAKIFKTISRSSLFEKEIYSRRIRVLG